MDNVEMMRGLHYNEGTFNLQGGCSYSSGNEKLKEDLSILLTQEKGKFYPDPEFGSDLHKYMFEPITPLLARRIRADLVSLIGKYYPQITIINIDIYSGENTLQIDIQYSYSDSQEADDELRLALFNQIGS